MMYELDLINYQNKCKLIRGWDELFTKVKEHINSVTAMKLSPFFKVRERERERHGIYIKNRRFYYKWLFIVYVIILYVV